METIVNIKNNLQLKEISEEGRTIITVLDGDKEVVLSNQETNEYYWTRAVFDDNYIVVYFRGCMENQMPLSIVAAYSIQERRVLDITNARMREYLEYMLISKKCFGLAKVLSEINDKDLQLINDNQKTQLIDYLTCNNPNITHKEVVSYILKEYPKLQKYTNLKKIDTLTKYTEIQNDLQQEYFFFHAMPQDINYLEKKYKLVGVYDEFGIKPSIIRPVFADENDKLFFPTCDKGNSIETTPYFQRFLPVYKGFINDVQYLDDLHAYLEIDKEYYQVGDLAIWGVQLSQDEVYIGRLDKYLEFLEDYRVYLYDSYNNSDRDIFIRQIEREIEEVEKLVEETINKEEKQYRKSR